MKNRTQTQPISDRLIAMVHIIVARENKGLKIIYEYKTVVE